MIRYFKPRKDVDYAACLLPQKIENGQQFKYESKGFPYVKEWHYTSSEPSYDLLSQNFIEVTTEEEAIA